MSYDEPTNEPPGQPRPNAGFSGGDLLASGPLEGPHRNVPAIVVSLVAVLAVIAGAAGYVGYHKLASSGSQPDQWAPANSIAFVKLDLDPAASEKISALRFEQNFPDAPHVTSADQLKDALLDDVFSDKSDTAKIDYATDVKPWLGDRVALAVYPGANGAAQVVGILAVKDAAAAKTGLTKLVQDQGDGAFALEGDYAIVGQTQTAVDAAVAAARASNITSASNYSSDIATLKGDRILTGWADLGAVLKLASNSGALANAPGLSSLSDLSGLSGLSGLGALSGLSGGGLTGGGLGVGSLASTVKGRFVFGLQLQPGSADFEGRLIGSDVSDYHNGTAGSLLGQLPAGSIAGVAVSGLGDILTKELAALEKSPLIAAGVQAQLGAIGTRLGITLPGDAINLLGNQFAAGLDAFPASAATAKFTILTQPTNQALGLATAQKLAGLIDQGKAAPTVHAAGSEVVVTNDAQASGSLADEPGFKAAMSGMPDQVIGAAYVDLTGVWAAVPGKVASDFTHLSGIGGYEAIDGNDVVFDARLTVS